MLSVFGKRNGGGRRRARREAAPTVAVFTTVAKSHPAVLVDLSSTGARLRTSELPEPAEELMISVENIRAFGSVAWVRGDHFGVAFDAPIGPMEVAQLKSKLVRAAGLAPELSAALEDWNTGLAR